MRAAPASSDTLQGLINYVHRICRDPFGRKFDVEASIAYVRAISDWRLLAHGHLIEALGEERPMLLHSLDLLHGHAFGLVG